MTCFAIAVHTKCRLSKFKEIFLNVATKMKLREKNFVIPKEMLV